MLVGDYFNNIKPEYKKHFFSGLSFNSLKCKKGNIFFAIKGTIRDGNKYIAQAIKNGCKVIVHEKEFEGIKKNILYIKSKNVRKDLSLVSFKYFKSRPKNIVAVTGTNGKSSIAEFYYQILTMSKKKVASIGTLGVKIKKNLLKVNNTTLDPITLAKYFKLLDTMKINNIILEASSHGLHQNRLDGIKFNGGIFTNLSHDHLDYHKSFNNYLNSKLYLFKKLLKNNSFIITNSKIPQHKKLKKIATKRKLKMISLFNDKGIEILDHNYIGEKQSVSFAYQKKNYSFTTNLIGKIQITNLLMASIAAQKSKIKFNKIVDNFQNMKPVNGRFEKIGNLKNKSLVILDYAHTPDALKVCLENIEDQFSGRNIKIVFGCGGDRDKLKRSKMGTIAAKFCKKIYITNDNPRNENAKKIRINIKNGIFDKKKIHEIPDREDAIKLAIKDLKTSEILIVAGKGHENTQIIKNKVNILSDRSIIKKSILKKNKLLSKNLKKNILKEQSGNLNLRFNIGTFEGVIDSRKVKKNDIFFAIKGENKDGNNYINDAFKNGAQIVVGSKKLSNNLKKYIKVNSPLKFLEKISTVNRECSDSVFIGITGSCGKTSLKEMTKEVFRDFTNISASKKSYNNKYGVPLSLFNFNNNHNYGIYEIGMDKKGEIDNLSKVVQPNIGVITNISYAHAKNFKSIKQIALAKSEIIHNIKKNGKIILNLDDKFFFLHKKIALKKNLKIFSFSEKNKNADVYLKKITKNKNIYKLHINVNGIKKYFFINSKNENLIKNILACLAIILATNNIKYLKYNMFKKINFVQGRGDISKVKVDKKIINLIDESYNSNPLSLKSAINHFKLLNIDNDRKYILLGDMLELGSHSKKLHNQLIKVINLTSIKNIFVIGTQMSKIFKKLKVNKKGLVLNNISQINDLIIHNMRNNDYLMIKGSNATGLNKYVNQLKGSKGVL
ncbi:MAG: UDP-N-acetylmuramoyl-L-alanyl-D-glutamate--2,6-diaminopimelate ligase [Candidatus Pelagibacter sp. TMED275]|nr:MAG: UDP-N-acetylmuramoyl-L-alanyl-D-glutamate--2,6-diaminopimelate ligase [Candidatus Pelagibacter sp. TMED275]